MVETHTQKGILNLKGIAGGLPKLSKKLAYHDADAHIMMHIQRIFSFVLFVHHVFYKSKKIPFLAQNFKAEVSG